MESVSISPGINLHVIPSDKFMTDTLCALIRRPLSRDEVTLNALLPAVLRLGSARYPRQTDMALAVEGMQGAVFESNIIKKGEWQMLQFYFECVSGDLSLQTEGVAFLQEIMLHPLTEGGVFKNAYVKNEIDNLQKRMEGRINNKREYALLKCVEFMCEDEPFGLYGDGYAEDLPSIASLHLMKQYKKTLATSPIDFIALGRWNQSRLAEQLSSLFNLYRDDRVDFPPISVKTARAKRRTEKLNTGSEQGNLCMGLRGKVNPSGDEYVRFKLANEILGGGPNAKLFVNVREKESLCYSIQSFVYRFKGILCIQAGVAAEHFEHALSLIEKEMDAVRQGAFTDEELNNAKQSLIKNWRSQEDYPSAGIDFYASQYLLNDPDTTNDLVNRVMSATREQVAETANTLTVDTVVMVA